MVTFADLQIRLVSYLRILVRNGEITERGLARAAGISQPHIHNVLKGIRVLSPSLSDQTMHHLGISLVDLMSLDELSRHSGTESPAFHAYTYLPMLSGRIGPGHGWPQTIDSTRKFPISRATIASYKSPLIARLAADARMLPAFAEGDLGVLDQSAFSRETIDPSALYLIKSGEQGLLRRLRLGAGSLYVVTEDSLLRPGAWEKISLSDRSVRHLVRARVTLLGPDEEWTELFQRTATSW